MFIALFDSYVIVSPSNVQLGEDMCSREAICEVSDEGEGVLVLDGIRIEAPVVLYRSQLSVSFLYEKER